MQRMLCLCQYEMLASTDVHENIHNNSLIMTSQDVVVLYFHFSDDRHNSSRDKCKLTMDSFVPSSSSIFTFTTLFISCMSDTWGGKLPNLSSVATLENKNSLYWNSFCVLSILPGSRQAFILNVITIHLIGFAQKMSQLLKLQNIWHFDLHILLSWFLPGRRTCVVRNRWQWDGVDCRRNYMLGWQRRWEFSFDFCWR